MAAVHTGTEILPAGKTAQRTPDGIGIIYGRTAVPAHNLLYYQRASMGKGGKRWQTVILILANEEGRITTDHTNHTDFCLEFLSFVREVREVSG
jgi:hypothetical protein